MLKTDVLKYFKTQTNLSKEIGITQSAISKWGDIVPQKQALLLAQITNNKLIYDASFYVNNYNFSDNN